MTKRNLSSLVRRLVAAILGIAVFILALWLLKTGASGLKPIMTSLHVSSPVNTLGFGWLMAYIVLSGSPVATIAITLLGSNVLSGVETFAMITGSRLGASFVVLFVGFIYWLRGRQRVASVSIGILALLVTASIYVPAMFLGFFILSNHLFSWVHIGHVGQAASLLDLIYDPIVHFLSDTLHFPLLIIFILGIGTLLGAFKIFDLALPEIDSQSSRFNRINELVYKPVFMLLLGAGITSLTLSVSVSLSLLVPLAVKGYIRRENVIPYIMGANITTFIDTLLAALLIPTPPGQPSAFIIVLTEMVSVSIVSALALLLSYSLYQRTIERVMETILLNNRRLAIFIGMILIVPIILLFI